MANLQGFIQSIAFDSERFLPVKDFEGRFWISDHGRILSKKYDKFKLFCPCVDMPGYYNITLRNKPDKRYCRVHQLVGEHFCEMIEKEGRMTWNHIDGNKLNNHYLNLEYITARENCAHARVIGLQYNKGESHKMSKLKDEQVREIYALRNTPLNFTRMGKKYNVSRNQIADIVYGRSWQHITSHLD